MLSPATDGGDRIKPTEHVSRTSRAEALIEKESSSTGVSPNLGETQISSSLPLKASPGSPPTDTTKTVTSEEANAVPETRDPSQIPVCDQGTSTITNKDANSNQCDPQEEKSTTSHGTTRAKVRTALAAGELRIPEFSGQKSNLVSLPAFAARDNPLTPYQSIRYRLPFGPAISPPNQDLEFKVQILENTRQWIFLASSIPDEKRRREILDRAFDKYEKVWIEALRIGYKSGCHDSGGSGPRGESNHQASERKVHATKSRKRDIPPHAAHVFTPEKFKNGQGRSFPITAITAGELEDAGLTEEQVRKRAHDGEYAQANEIFRDVYDDLGRKIVESDWQSTTTRTTLNPTGRDLFFYSLYVAQLYEMSLRQLQRYQSSFRTPNQIKNGLRNIDKTEQDRRIFLALALELAELESTSDMDESIIAEDDNVQGSATIVADTRQRLLAAVDMVLETHDFNDVHRAFEASGCPKSLLDIDDRVKTISTPDDQCKTALANILSYATSRASIVHEIEHAQNQDERNQRSEQLEVCETKLRMTKKCLRQIAGLMMQAHTGELNVRQNGSADQIAGKSATVPAHVVAESELPQSQVLNLGLKRPAEADFHKEDDSDLPAKRQRLDIHVPREHISNGSNPDFDKQAATETENADIHTSGTVNGQSIQDLVLHPSSVAITREGTAPRAGQETPFQQPLNTNLTKKDYYVREILIPLANTLLTTNGYPPMPPTIADYQGAKNALIASGLSVTERNKLGIEYNKGLYNDWNIALESDGMDEQQDPASPSHNEFILSDRKDVDEIAYPPSRSDPHQGRALVVKLKVGQNPDYDPAQFSCNNVYQHKGFRYRYTQESTFAERKAADDVLDRYVRDRVKQHGDYPRYGRYETVCLPGDPEQKIVVHGIWDTKDARPIKGAEWFYTEGRKHPSLEIGQPSDIEDEDDEDDWNSADGPQASKRTSSSMSSTKKSKKVAFTRQTSKDGARRISAPKQPGKKSTMNPKVVTAIRLRVNANNAQGNANDTSKRGQTGTSKAKSNKGGVASAAGRSKGRPKRTTSQRSYIEDDFQGASEDEYVPGLSD